MIDRLPVGQIDEFACRQLDRVSAFVVVVLAFVPAVPSPPHPPSSLCPTSLYHRRLSLQPHIFSLASSPAGVICHALLRRRLASRARRVAPYPNSPTRSEPNQEMTFRGRQRIPCSRFERCAGSTRRRGRFCAVRLSRVGPRIGPARRRGGAGAGAVVARVYPTVLPGSPLAPGASRMLSSFAAGLLLLLLLLLLPLLLAFFTRCMDGLFCGLEALMRRFRIAGQLRAPYVKLRSKDGVCRRARSEEALGVAGRVDDPDGQLVER